MALNVASAGTSAGNATNPLTTTITVSAGTVYVGVTQEDPGSISAVTVGGVSASVVPSSAASNPSNKTEWWVATGVTPGAGKTVSVTAGWATSGGFAFVAVDVPNGLTATANLLATASSTAAVAKTISVLDGDIVLAADSMGDTPHTVTWTNATEIADMTGNSMTASGAYAEIASDNASYTVTCTADSSSNRHALSLLILRASPTVSDVSPASPKPGELVTFTLTGYSSAPLSANCSYNGVGLTLEAGATNASAQAYWPAIAAFQGGAHNATEWNTNHDLIIANGSETDTVSVQTATPTLQACDSAGDRDLTTYPTVYDWEPAGLADGDYVYIYNTTNDQGSSNAAAGAISPAGSSTWKYMWWDVSAGAWGTTETISAGYPVATAPEIEPDGGEFAGGVTITMTSDIEGASIFYTTDGETPTVDSTLYSAPFVLTEAATVKAIVMAAEYEDSAVTSAVFDITELLGMLDDVITRAIRLRAYIARRGGRARYTPKRPWRI